MELYLHAPIFRHGVQRNNFVYLLTHNVGKICPFYLSQNITYWKSVLNIKFVPSSRRLCSKIPHFWATETSRNAHTCTCNVPVSPSGFDQKWDVIMIFRKNSHMSNFTEISETQKIMGEILQLFLACAPKNLIGGTSKCRRTTASHG